MTCTKFAFGILGKVNFGLTFDP